eukprot:3720386-Amphidinium_carterae.1
MGAFHQRASYQCQLLEGFSARADLVPSSAVRKVRNLLNIGVLCLKKGGPLPQRLPQILKSKDHRTSEFSGVGSVNLVLGRQSQ